MLSIYITKLQCLSRNALDARWGRGLDTFTMDDCKGQVRSARSVPYVEVPSITGYVPTILTRLTRLSDHPCGSLG